MVLALAVLASAGPRRAGAGVRMGTIEETEEAKHAKAKEQAKAYYKDGMQALAEGNVARAVQRLLWVAKMGRMRIDSPYPEQAFEQLKILADRGAKDLAVARELVAGEDHAAGVKELRRITRVYLGLAPAKEAGRLLRELEKDPAFREAVLAQGLADDFEKARALEAEAEAILHPPAAGAPESEPQSAEPPKQVEEPSEDSIIPLDVMTRLKPKKVVSLKKMKKQLDVEGDAMLVDRTGFVIGEEADNVFVIDELGRNVEQISFQLLPCQAIQRVERKQNQSPARQRYRIAAIVTKYKGDYYLLFQRAVRTYSHGNFAR